MKLRKCTLPDQSTCFLQDQLGQLPFDAVAELLAADSAEQDAFYRFAGALGCFSRAKYVDEDGNETPTILGQKASTLLRQLLAAGHQAMDEPNHHLHLGDFATLFPNLPAHCRPNPRLLDFIGHTIPLGNNNVQYPYLTTLLSLERDPAKPLPGLFQKVVLDFPKAHRFMQTKPDGSHAENLLVFDGLQRFYHAPAVMKYHGMTHRTRELGFLCASYGLGQNVFDCAAASFNRARHQQTPHHILGTPLAEPVGSADFTFEMLDKRDPRNAILGVLCSCCATTGSPFYGSGLTQMAIYEPDIQNMVVRNRLGEIIAKGTLRIIAARAQAVFNTLAVNERYRRQKNKKQIQILNNILDAFMRGVQAVVTTYDQKHPDQPLQIVTVGMECNKLGEQCLRYPYAKPDEQVDPGGQFHDATAYGQFVLYRAAGQEQQAGTERGR